MNTGRHRDRMLDQALKQTLGRGDDTPASPACLDAETLAAWVDAGLDVGSAARAEVHVSGCTRCQALVGALARATPEIEPGAGARTPSWRWWLAPIAVGAAATTLWIVVPGERYAAPPAPPPGQIAQAPSADLAAEGPPAGTLASPPATEARPAADALRRDAPAEAPAAAEAKRRDEVAPTREAERVEAPDAGARPQVRMASPPATLGQSFAAHEIASPDPAVRWRIEAGGAVDYTADDGATWERLPTGVTAHIAAGSSPSPTVCWLVGAGGVVLVTSDGRTFARVPFAEAADLVDVQASDARTAAVTAADGRVFVTDDRGLTWRQRE